MIKLTGFADEISMDPNEQMQVLDSLGIKHMELRKVWGKGLLELDENELDELENMLSAHQFQVSSIASPIGKYDIDDPFESELQRMNKAIKIAQRFRTPYIRIFSYYIPDGESAESYRNEVMRRLSQLTDLASESNIILILENDSGVYGNIDTRTIDILTTINSPYLRSAFDPGNFIINGVLHVSKTFKSMYSYIEYMHMKDANSENRQFVPCGDGDAEIEALLQLLKEHTFSGFLSIEPHLHKAYPNHTDGERFVIAAKALIDLLKKYDIEWA